jgi:hypothetical protein
MKGSPQRLFFAVQESVAGPSLHLPRYSNIPGAGGIADTPVVLGRIHCRGGPLPSQLARIELAAMGNVDQHQDRLPRRAPSAHGCVNTARGHRGCGAAGKPIRAST